MEKKQVLEDLKAKMLDLFEKAFAWEKKNVFLRFSTDNPYAEAYREVTKEYWNVRQGGRS